MNLDVNGGIINIQGVDCLIIKEQIELYSNDNPSNL